MTMMRIVVPMAALLIGFAGSAECGGGLFSALRDRGKKKDADQSAVQPPPQVPPPAEQAGMRASKTPTSEEIKAGAARLKQQLSWDKIPSDLFKNYEGKWNGHFWAYSPLGKKEQVNRVSIEYTRQGDHLMSMKSFSFDMISKTWVTEETATYQIDGDRVLVQIKRPTGRVSRQTGHYSDGQLFLRAEIDDGSEHFRERIDGKRLLIDGFGIYGSLKGNDQHVFIGRFLKE